MKEKVEDFLWKELIPESKEWILGLFGLLLLHFLVFVVHSRIAWAIMLLIDLALLMVVMQIWELDRKERKRNKKINPLPTP